ncbi:DUF4239 domain-containing protein [Pseudoxanthomonas koreensis]|uniref:bestrophin-like domain n=1 Tax=Pseudoxanthomonas koreensis TaxID=266061 RepID=UPI001390BBEB|nr:DUF4239 domain-containing protein [Pseudoxanthomonas koreensis]
MFQAVFSLPLWAVVLVLNTWLVGFALAGAWTFRRWVLPRLDIGDEADLFYGAAVMQSAMMLYALVAALTAVSVWNRYSEAAEVVSGEATAIARMWRDLGSYPQPERQAMQDSLRAYTVQVIDVAWPLHRKGKTPREGVVLINRLQEQLYAYKPAAATQGILHAEALAAYNNLVVNRNKRLDAADDALPGVMWFVLLPGAMGCVALSFFFRIRDARYQYILAGGLASFVAMVLFVIVALDHPFRGVMSISPESYELIRDQLMRP